MLDLAAELQEVIYIILLYLMQMTRSSLVSCGKSVKWVCCRQLSCCEERNPSVFALLSGQVEDSEQFLPMAVLEWSSGLPAPTLAVNHFSSGFEKLF